ncbi:phosphopantetheine-binding protein [Neopusillimonas aromaticivorans]|uniref:phosphopantetheine-binding protein n=1 Tax=Neopusillimonas aromaticivorans TaxID=2979868 RepID=UPI00259239FB|nr:phosphopantetheine-binding protein [Neopusillimonas aromaticivorans]NLZ12505.1 acyl carrier protein [Alcaligenaceae bacterium]WJJ92889.1 phosphopantetheine-binding protein [Neopusillimonas aromaticivorans]
MTVTARELAILFVDALDLEDVDPQLVDLNATLFGDGLGLDSLDMLEIALIIQQKFGLKIKADNPDIEQIFGSLENLASYINSSTTVQA